jgi:hypothetical protein
MFGKYILGKKFVFVLKVGIYMGNFEKKIVYFETFGNIRHLEGKFDIILQICHFYKFSFLGGNLKLLKILLFSNKLA